MMRIGRIALRSFILVGGIPAALLVLFSISQIVGALPPQNLVPGPKPQDVPAEWKGLIGEYGPDSKPILVLEKGALLEIIQPELGERALTQVGRDTFRTGSNALPVWLTFTRDKFGIAQQLTYSQRKLSRRNDGLDQGQVFQITPRYPLTELLQDALVAAPPQEVGPFRKPDLVELALLDPAIHLDVRYASSNNFLGTAVYSQARAFLQRLAAEALVRVLKKLKLLGYGLLIHDAYRPWYVTKIFWEATPPEGKIFVADPTQGSRHNRGCAVDLTLYDLATGKPIEMPGTYDEMSPRSFPTYAGGTSLQRWHRELLRSAMESEGFTVYDAEWWHFDYKDWKEYPILNVPFEKLGVEQGSTLTH